MHVESLRTQFELLGNTNTLHSTHEPKQPQLTGNNNTSSDQLLMLSTSLKAEMNKSLVLENRMNDDYLREGAEYQQFSHQLSVLREKSQSYQNKINTHVIELNQLKEKFSQVAQEISIHNEKISDTQVLHDIKNSLTRIKAEIQQLDCNLEVCRQRWFTLQLKKQDQRRKNGHNKYSKKSFSRHHHPHHHSEDTSDEDEDERSNQSDD
jgi:chromosome segregation ATPase